MRTSEACEGPGEPHPIVFQTPLNTHVLLAYTAPLCKVEKGALSGRTD